jgi:hypothetical protein
VYAQLPWPAIRSSTESMTRTTYSAAARGDDVAGPGACDTAAALVI